VLTIATAFSDKEFCLERTLSSMEKLHLPDFPVQWVFMDNSGNSRITNKLRYFLSQRENTKGTSFTKLIVNPKTKYSFTTLYEMYNDLKEHIKGNWFSIEDDVTEFPPDTISRMYREIYSRYDLGIVAAYMQIRRGWEGSMAWRVQEFDDPDGGTYLGLKDAIPRNETLGIVDAVHTGCTLIRPSVYLGYTFRQEGEADKILGHDIHMCIDAKRERGISTGVLWNLRAGHMAEEGMKYPQGVSNVLPQFEAQTTKPLVSVITPSCHRPKRLERVIEQLKRQTYPHWEQLICNDGPAKYVSNVVEKADDSRLRYYELGYRHGFSGAPQRNLMLQKCGGELVVFVDDDVQLEDDYLETMVGLWKTGYVVGFCQVEIEDATTGKTSIIPESRDKIAQVGHIDTLCGYVDSSIAKGFFWDLFDEHDARYWQQILSFTRGDCGFKEKVVGSNVRSFGKGEDTPNAKVPLELVQQISRSVGSPTPEMEEILLDDPQSCLQYVMNALNGERWEKGEPTIARNKKTALFYTANVLNGERFEIAEDNLSNNLPMAVAYARTVKTRWKDMGNEEVEEAIMKEPLLAVDYLEAFENPAGLVDEEVLKQDPRVWAKYLEKTGQLA